MLTNEILKIAEEMAKTKNLKRYLRSNVLNQSKGLTDFIKAVEAKAQSGGISFSIISASVYEVIPYEQTARGQAIYHEEDKEFLFRDYVSFIYNNEYYYFQIDDNPFFRHSYYRIIPQEDAKGLFYYGYMYSHACDPLGCLDVKDLYGYNNTAREQIKNNLLKIFSKASYSSTYRGRGKSNAQIHKTRIESHIYYGV